MKVRLRSHILIPGESNTRTVLVASVDWDRRFVTLPDRRWVPFENVEFGEPEESEGTGKVYQFPPAAPLKCDRCQRVFDKASALGGHRRHCK